MSETKVEPLVDFMRAATSAFEAAFHQAQAADDSAAESPKSAPASPDGVHKVAYEFEQLFTAWLKMLLEPPGPESLHNFMTALHAEWNRAWDRQRQASSNAESLRWLTAEWQTRFQRWLEQRSRYAKYWTEALDRSFSDPDAFASLTGLLFSPGFGLTRGFQEKWARVVQAWLEYQGFEDRYVRLVGTAWFESLDALVAQLTDEGDHAESSEDPFERSRQTVQKWVECADQIFGTLFRTEAYCESQAQLINSMMRFKIARREAMEDVLVAFDIPTRSEIDDANRMLYSMRKELKELRRELTRVSSRAEPV